MLFINSCFRCLFPAKPNYPKETFGCEIEDVRLAGRHPNVKGLVQDVSQTLMYISKRIWRNTLLKQNIKILIFVKFYNFKEIKHGYQYNIRKVWCKLYLIDRLKYIMSHSNMRICLLIIKYSHCYTISYFFSYTYMNVPSSLAIVLSFSSCRQ